MRKGKGSRKLTYFFSLFSAFRQVLVSWNESRRSLPEWILCKTAFYANIPTDAKEKAQPAALMPIRPLSGYSRCHLEMGFVVRVSFLPPSRRRWLLLWQSIVCTGGKASTFINTHTHIDILFFNHPHYRSYSRVRRRSRRQLTLLFLFNLFVSNVYNKCELIQSNSMIWLQCNVADRNLFFRLLITKEPFLKTAEAFVVMAIRS